MPGVVALLLLVVPLIELWVILAVADRIGILETIVALIAVAVAGTWLLIREGTATWRRFRNTLAEGQVPTGELADGALILIGGALLLTPGFITDIVGLFFLFPVTRAATRRAFRRFLSVWVVGRFGAAGAAGSAIYETRVRNVRRKGSSEGGTTPPTVVPPLPSEPLPSDSDDLHPPSADDSRDRG